MVIGFCFPDAALFLKIFQVGFNFWINGFWLKVVLIPRKITAYVTVWSDHSVSAQENLSNCLLPETLSGQSWVCDTNDHGFGAQETLKQRTLSCGIVGWGFEKKVKPVKVFSVTSVWNLALT